jgi:ligand-binding sensor domain-containing protein
LAGGTLCAQEYNFRNFGVAEGLSNLTVRRIYQDRVGFIWVSTENGIFRYDGDRFEAFGAAEGIPSNAGVAFGAAPDGSLLAGADFGLYQLSGNRFEKLTFPFKTINWAQGIQSDGKGHTYLGTDIGLVELYSQPGQQQFAMHTFPQPQGTSGPAVFGILIEQDVVWYGCGTELCRMDARGTQVFGRNSGLPGRPVLVIRKDGDGNLWVRVRNDGVFVRLAGHKEFQKPNLPVSSQHLGGVPVVDGAGRILLPSSVGLLIGDKDGWKKIDSSVGLRGTVYSVLEDRQRTLWIGLAGRGLAQWRGYREWESYSTESGLASDIVYEILPRADGSLWVATEAGIFRGERRQLGMTFKSIAGLDGLAVHSLRSAPNGDVWIGTETRGAARIDSRTHKSRGSARVRDFQERQPTPCVSITSKDSGQARKQACSWPRPLIEDSPGSPSCRLRASGRLPRVLTQPFGLAAQAACLNSQTASGRHSPRPTA